MTLDAILFMLCTLVGYLLAALVLLNKIFAAKTKKNVS